MPLVQIHVKRDVPDDLVGKLAEAIPYAVSRGYALDEDHAFPPSEVEVAGPVWLLRSEVPVLVLILPSRYEDREEIANDIAREVGERLAEVMGQMAYVIWDPINGGFWSSDMPGRQD